jgi:hypothetical protein
VYAWAGNACAGRRSAFFTRQHGVQGLLHDASQASEDVRRTRGRVATLKGRLGSLLSSQPGEVTEQVSGSYQSHKTISIMSVLQAVCNVR